LGIEQDVAASLATRRRLLEGCVDTNTLVMAAHFLSPTAGRVVSHGDELRFQFTPE
jgi:hypothetical protein